MEKKKSTVSDVVASGHRRLYIPQAHGLILATRNQAALLVGIPVEAETFRFVANELNLCIYLAQTRWLQRMLRSVKDEDFAVDAKSSNNVRVLRLITGLVDFSRMLNPLHDVALEGSNIACLSIASDLASFLVVVVGVRRHGFGYLDIGDLEEVGTVVRSVCSEQKTVHAIVFALGFLDVREPLNGKRGPSQGSPGAERLEQQFKPRTTAIEESTNPRIMSYRNGLFFFHVLYSIPSLDQKAAQCEARSRSRSR